jgi:hypothetical protein
MSTARPDGEEIYKAFIEFVSSTNWARSFDILEARRDLLLPLGARLLLIQFLAEPDDKEMRQRFALHLTLLEIAAADGIAAARSLVDDALRQGQQGGAGNDVAMHSTIVTSSGYGVPAGGSAPSPARAATNQSGDSNLEEILKHLPPEEQAQVRRNLGLAQPDGSSN